MSQAQASANAYLELQTAARQLLTIDLTVMAQADTRSTLAELTARRDEVNRTSDAPSRYARWKAKRNMAEGGQQYEIDQSK